MATRAFTQWFLDRERVQQLLVPAKRQYFVRAGAITMREARKLIKRKGHARPMPKSPKARARWRQEVRTRPASPPGTPPYTHTGLLRQAILFSLDPTSRSVVVGPTAELVDDIGALHEWGGRRFGRRYPPRPYMRPALKNVQAKLARLWQNAIRQ